MKTCKEYQQWTWLELYEELPADQKKELQDHLKSCIECQLVHKETKETHNLLDKKIHFEPTTSELEANRAELHQRLLFAKQNQLKKLTWIKRWQKLWGVISLEFAPPYRLATALAMLVIGIFLGRFFLTTGPVIQPGEIATADSNIASVDYVQYHPNTKKVSIKLNVVNEMIVEGDVQEPHIQVLLAQALETSQRPNIRLKTLDALNNAQTLSNTTQNTLVEVLQTDANPGIRLKAIRLLNTLPIDSQVRELLMNSLIRVLMNEDNPAIRNEAVDGLTRFEDEDLTPLIMDFADQDTNEYLQYKVSEIQRTKLER